ncbi:hypothetical protein [Erwinia phage vB_Ea277G]|nr:hypothetical protein [Erwinia phage vB_Ea277G]
MTELEITDFYRRFGVKAVGNLGMPRLFDLENWAAPKNAVYHYIPQSMADFGPDINFFPVRLSNKKPYLLSVDTLGELNSLEGNVRRIGSVNLTNLIRTYLRKHPEFRRVDNWERVLQDRKVPIMFNYGLAPLQYKYAPLPLTRLYRFKNMMRSVYGNIAKVVGESDRNHFIIVRLPEKIPLRMHLNRAIESMSLAQIFAPLSHSLQDTLQDHRQNREEQEFDTYGEFFRAAHPELYADDDTGLESFDETPLDTDMELHFNVGDSIAMESGVSVEEMSRMTLGLFENDTQLLIADMWKWLSDNRADSLMGLIPEEHLDKVNLVFTESGKFSVLNLGRMNGFREDKEQGKQGLGFSALSKNFSVYLSSMTALRSVADPARVLESIPDNTEDEPVALAVTGDSGENTVQAEVSSDPTTGIAPTVNPGQTLGAAGAGKKLTVKSVLGKTNEPVKQPHSVSIPVEVEEDVQVPVMVNNTDPLVAGIDAQTQELLSQGVLSVAERRRFLKMAERYKELPAPFDDGTSKTLAEFMDIPHGKLWDFKPRKIPDNEHVPDKSMLESTLMDYDPVYIKEVFHKDTARMVMHFQKAGFAITQYDVERNTDALNDLNSYVLKFNPVSGISTPVKFQLPVIQESGKYMVGGVKYYMRKLRTDKPIRKIADNQVSLSTYYPNKLMVMRSGKKVDNYGTWLTDGMRANILSESATIEKVVYGKSYAPQQPVPRTYSAVAMEFVEFQTKGYQFFFDYPNIMNNFGATPKSNDYVPVAKALKGNGLLYMDHNGYLYNGLGPEMKTIGSFAEFVGMDPAKEPTEIATVTVLGEEVPLAAVLTYLVGIKGLTEMIGGPDRRRVKGTKRDTTDKEFEIAFEDEIWVFPKNGTTRSLVWGSLSAWRRGLRSMPMSDFDSRDSFFPLFNEYGLNARHLREIDLLDKLFIDPISADVLRQMKEPDNFVPLLIKAAHYLVTDEYPDDQSADYALYKGYERMNGAVYRSICKSVRQYASHPNRGKAAVDVNPFDVLMSIQQDPSVSLVEESNPIHNLKEKESVTYSGVGGRSKRSMVRRTRAFHPTDVGTRSEATVDSGDVGINFSLSANPNLTSLRGTTVGLDAAETGTARMLSTSALVSPFATYDDPKRVNFISIQQDHAVATVGTEISPIRTGYERVMAHRVDDLFAKTAKAAGKITEKTDEYVVITYDDPKLGEERIEIGRRFGTVTGKCFPHDLVCDLEVGTKFKEGAGIAYNTGFFARDWRNPMDLCWKNGAQAYVGLWETNDTYEDSSRISRRLSGKLLANTSHIRTILLNFDQNAHQLVKVGDVLDVDDVLCYIEEALAGQSSLNDETVENLKRLSRSAPRAKYKGTVDKIEVIYFGDKEDMSASLSKIATKADGQRARLAKALGKGAATTGRITTPARVDGQQVDLNMVAIRVFITGQTLMGDGDKLVVGNQLKSVITGTIEGTFQTDGEVIKGAGPVDVDVQFSYRSINARIVNSPILMGIGNLLLEALGREMAAKFNA